MAESPPPFPADLLESGGSYALLGALSTWVARQPEAPAVRGQGGATLTYGALEAASNRLARGLQAKGCVPDDRVAVCLERSPEMIVAVLAAWKAGAGYVPLDPAYPTERLAYMLENADPRVVITDRALAGRLPLAGRTVLLVDEERPWWDAFSPEPVPPSGEGTDLLGYVIYTSGSTGKPKGVALGRRALTNLIAWQLGESRAAPGARTLQFSPLSFDVSFQEIFSCLCAGGELVLISEALRLDAPALLRFLEEERVERLFLPFVALQALAEASEGTGVVPASLREVVTAGEQLQATSSLRAWFKRMPWARLHNHYGPSETHVVTAYTLTADPDAWAALPPIGRALPGVTTHLLDERGEPVPRGEAGALFLGGVALARGYLGRADLTEERFVPDRFSTVPGARLYRTGDLARELDDGNLEFLGRGDDQVKVRGYRIELGEVELALADHPTVKQAVVVAREDVPGDKRLVAYVATDAEPGTLAEALRKHLEPKLPDYMLPSAFVELVDFPRTPSGKVDRRALPAPDYRRPELAGAYVAPAHGLESDLARLWASVLRVDRVGALDGFFALGGNSLLALRLLGRVRAELGREVSPVKLFEHPTVRALAAHMEGRGDSRSVDDATARAQTKRAERQRGHAEDGVAIVGMAVRVPGAESLESFWANLRAGVDSITQFADGDLDPSIPPSILADPSYVKARGTIQDADKFDAKFFGVNPREAEALDPQQRVFLEVAWSALEHAGYAPNGMTVPVGVYAGTGNNTYYATRVLTNEKLLNAIGEFNAMVANEKDYVATRVAHKLNLKGPALSIVTACSTSLVAVAEAVEALRLRHCDVALAGGASVTCPPRSGYLHQSGGMLSSDGTCRPFDARAEGTVFSDGAGAVVLKRLEDALRDGDHVWAVIRGVGLNNDGAEKMSFTAPSVDGQAAAVAQAHADAGFAPASISYVETHGTATPLGDPIEVEALAKAFGEGLPRGACVIGSVKGNFGHLTAAAGVTGLVKTALALAHGEIPPTPHFERPNPEIPFERTPFRVNAALEPWRVEEGGRRRAGVSSFGVGGTNAHVVLEEAPAQSTARNGAGAEDRTVAADGAPTEELLVWSARTEAALGHASERLAVRLEERARSGDGPPLRDWACTLREGRTAMPFRRAAVAGGWADAAEGVRAEARAPAQPSPATEPGLVFVFPGQGAQYAGMGARLYADEPVFREVIDRVASAVADLVGRDLRGLLFPKDDARAEADMLLAETRFTQPAIFAIEAALATLLQHWGLRPQALIGHSIGEFAAAVVAGVFSLEDAAQLVARRAALMQAMPPGVMLSVRARFSRLEGWLEPGLSLASENAPELCVVGGDAEAVGRLEARLQSEGIAAQRLRTSHAFHTPSMAAVVDPFGAAVSRVERGAPALKLHSTAEPGWLGAGRAVDPGYWAEHVTNPVRFSTAVRNVWAEDPTLLFVEVGPRGQMTALVRHHMTDRGCQVAIGTMPVKPESESERRALLAAVGNLWVAGANPDWRAVRGGRPFRRVPLPTYPFERVRYWSEPGSATLVGVLAPGPLGAAAPSLTPPSRAPTVDVPVPNVRLPEEDRPVPRTLSRRDHLVPLLKTMLEEASGLDLAGADEHMTLLEMGLDSLLMTQVALNLGKKFGVKFTFRELLDDYPTLDALATHLDGRLPAGAFAPPEVMPAASQGTPPAAPGALPVATPAETARVEASLVPVMPLPAGVVPAVVGGAHAPPGVNPAFAQVFAQQLSIIQQQLAVMGVVGGPPTATVAGNLSAPLPVSVGSAAPAGAVGSAGTALASTPAAATEAPKRAFGPGARIERQNTKQLDGEQRAWLERFIADYARRTAKSKAFTAENRAQLADPRVVSGFTPLLKEITYPIVVDRSAGSKLHDLDGNEYIDITVGFGTNFLGHHPKFVDDAIRAQLDRGYEIGPQHPLTAEVATLVRELTGVERVAFCNTGSEAVLGAMRLARTVTGNDTIVMFNGAYHGIFDEVIVRGTKSLKSMPAAPGIPEASVANTLLLEYDDPTSLEVIRARAKAGELAAVLVETVQSRRPGLQPKAFLEELRRITAEHGVVLIFDEVITGFRIAPGGAQEHFGIRADLVTYGKIPGGGMPIGLIGGKAAFMDALDGGAWRFGDDSVPTVGVTYFAGTFVRHPLTLAAAKATLTHLKQEGPSLQRRVNALAERFVAKVNGDWERRQCGLHIENFGSLFKVKGTDELPWGALVYHALRHRGVHVWDARPCFITAAHSESDVERLAAAFIDAVDSLQAVRLLPGNRHATANGTVMAGEGAEGNPHGAYTANGTWAPKTVPGWVVGDAPPVPGAKLGRDPDGSPAWYAPDPERPGRYLRVGPA